MAGRTGPRLMCTSTDDPSLCATIKTVNNNHDALIMIALPVDNDEVHIYDDDNHDKLLQWIVIITKMIL